jgi:uncharacterized RDD family membrane protein YckC
MDSGPPRPVQIELDSDPPPVEVDISFADEAITDPEPDRRPQRAGPASRLLAWTVDGALLAAALLAFPCLATLVVPAPYLLEAIASQLPLWLALAGCLALAYSWLFAALGARTPGMALAGQRLQTLQGDPPTPAEALVRAALSLASAALGLFGFALALFDARGQTLHDKLCRCVVVISHPDA